MLVEQFLARPMRAEATLQYGQYVDIMIFQGAAFNYCTSVWPQGLPRLKINSEVTVRAIWATRQLHSEDSHRLHQKQGTVFSGFGLTRYFPGFQDTAPPRPFVVFEAERTGLKLEDYSGICSPSTPWFHFCLVFLSKCCRLENTSQGTFLSRPHRRRCGRRPVGVSLPV